MKNSNDPRGEARRKILQMRREGRAEVQKPLARAVARLSARALVANYHAIRKLAGDQEMIPMIKADAYGHDAAWAARILDQLPGLYAFGVATLEEGAEVRTEIGGRTPIQVFSGAMLWSEDKGSYCEKYGLTPVIASESDWELFFKGGWTERIPYELKFNTGMNRLGLLPASVPKILRSLKSKSATSRPRAVMSHFADSEHPDSKLSLEQRRRFEAIRGEFDSALPGTIFHLANSGAIWNSRKFRLEGLTDVVRPGLSLYGVPPWRGAPPRGIEPVMTFEATIVHSHLVQPGESVGYGGSFSVPRGGDPVRVGILSVGYADGLHRALSGGGHAWAGGEPTRFLGRVSMDLSAIRLPAGAKVGDRAEVFGPHVDPWAQAEAAGTIPYELLTSVSARVERVHE